MVVDIKSQSGGLPSAATTIVSPQVHIGSPANGDVIAEVINALNKNPSDADYFSQNGFAPIKIRTQYKMPDIATISGILPGSLHIKNPAQNQNFNPGHSIPINISSSNSINKIVFEAINIETNGFVKDTVLSNGTINYRVPFDAFEQIQFIALGFIINRYQ